MNVILFVLCIRSIFATEYKITFGKKIYFDKGKVENPYSRTIHGTNSTDLIICYEDADAAGRPGLCEIGLLDTVGQNITFGSQSKYDAPSSDVFEAQLAGPNGPLLNVLVGYTSAVEGARGPGKLAVGAFDLTSNSITYGPPTTFNVGDNDQSNIIELSRNDSIFAVCYSVGNNDQKGTGCRLGQYDTQSLSVKFGSQLFTIPSNGLTDGMGVSRALNNGTFVVCYANTGYRIGECVVGFARDLDRYGVNGVIQYSSPVIFNADGNTDQIEIHHIYKGYNNPDANLVICYNKVGVDGECAYLVVDTDNSVNPLEVRSSSIFDPSDSIDQPTAQVIYPNELIGNTEQLVMVCYVDVGPERKETAGCIFGEVDTYNDKVIFEMQTISNFEFDGADKIDALYLGGNNMIVCYVDGSENNNRAPCIFGVISMVQ